MVHIVKRKGHKEEYDGKKVYASVYAACRNVHLSETESEEIANRVFDTLNKWVEDREELTSKEIFDKVRDELAKYNQDASFMYETHLDVS